MTAQINDTLVYKGIQYNIISVESILKVEQFGIKPKMIHTACWRGFYCTFVVQEDDGDKLYLDDLTVLSKDGIYPDINGKTPVPEASFFKNYGDPIELYNGPFQYKNIHMPMDFSGRITIADGFIKEHYIHQGLQHPFAYKKVLELTFRNGRIVGKEDHSRKAESRRRIICANTKPVVAIEWE